MDDTKECYELIDCVDCFRETGVCPELIADVSEEKVNDNLIKLLKDLGIVDIEAIKASFNEYD